MRYMTVGSLDSDLGKRLASLKSLGFICDMVYMHLNVERLVKYVGLNELCSPCDDNFRIHSIRAAQLCGDITS